MLLNIFALGMLLACLNMFHALPQASNQLEKARQLFNQKNYGAAEEAVREILVATPDDAKANYLLGLSLLEQGKHGEAEEAFTKVDQLIKDGDAPEIDKEDPEYPRAEQVLIGLARAHMGKEDLEKAAKSLDDAEKIRSDNPELYYYRGMLDARRKDYASAAENLEKSTELDPTNAYAHYHAGLAYNQIKRPDKMVQHFQFFLKLAPEAPEAAKVRALLKGIR